VEEGHLATRTVEKGHPVEKGRRQESGSNQRTVAAQRRSEFISNYRMASKANGINNNILTGVPTGGGAT
jgi:hypothetical protein